MKQIKYTKTQQKILELLTIGTESEEVENPFSGVVCVLEPTAVALYDYIMGCQALGNYKYFDQARYLFCALWPDEYMKLLD